MNTSSSVPPPKRRNWQAAAVLLVVFLAGLGSGAGGAFLLFQRQIRHVLSSPADSPRPIDRLLVVWEKRLASDLQLNESERAAVHASLQNTGTRLRDLRVRSAAELRALVRSAIAEVGENLPPEKADRARAAFRARLAPWGLGLPAAAPEGEGQKKM